MNRIHAFMHLLTYTLAVMVFACGHTTALAAPKRPVGVPDNYVVTPFGYFHPTCVRPLAEGDTILKDERAVRHANGTRQTIQACNYPRYNAIGEVIAQGPLEIAPPSIYHAWIESGSVTSTSSYAELDANWIVPPAPTANDDQIVYFFPGLEDSNNVVSILQPVLGWNAYASNVWGIASWNCCITGAAFESTPVAVQTGDIIFGSIKSTCSAGTLSCPTWNVVSTDVTSGKSTALSNTSSVGQTFNWAFEGALEVYFITQCSDYPPNTALTLYNVALYDDNFNRIANPGWAMGGIDTSYMPQCGYGGRVAPAQITLNYGVSAPVNQCHSSGSPVMSTSPSVGLGVTVNNPGGCAFGGM